MFEDDVDPRATSPAAPLETPPSADETQPPAYDAEGIDRSLIRESLERTPAERLDLADAYAVEIEMLRTRVRAEPFKA